MPHPRLAFSAFALSAAFLLGLGCGVPEESAQTAADEESATQNPFYVDPAGFDFSRNPKLVAKLRATPHRYFRFVNVPFSREVCRRFVAEAAGGPSFNLHGDAHVEQYAVTDLGRGLTDFDDSSIGPAVIDLMRYGVSLFLACKQQGCGEDPATLFAEFLRGYRAALEDPTLEAPEPRLAAAKRAKFSTDPAGYYRFVDSVMEPVPEDEARDLETALAPYVRAMHEDSAMREDGTMREDGSGLDEDFFTIERLGYLRMGVGSALDLKYLVRVRGESADPLDDVVLQVKQVRDLGGIPCVASDPGADPLRVLRGHLRLATEPFRFLGYARLRGRNFWVHAWLENYSELAIEEAFAAEGEMAEVAFDVGVQLGRGHPRQAAGPLARQVRGEQIRLIDRDAAELEAGCRELADLTVAAWERFKAEIEG